MTRTIAWTALAALAALLAACAASSDDDSQSGGAADDDAAPTDDDHGPADDDDNDDSAPNEYSVTVDPPPAGNPLARRLIVTSSRPCMLSGRVTTDGEDGFGPSDPLASERGTNHVLWFYGLLEDRSFHYAINLAGDLDAVAAAGEFETPKLPWYAPQPFIKYADPGLDPSRWFAATINTLLSPHGVGATKFVIVFDRQGRLRYYHETEGDAGDPAAPLHGFNILADGTIVFSDVVDLVAAQPNGDEAVMFDLKLPAPVFKESHHEFYLDAAANQAWILFNRFGPGLECDLRTYTDRAVGDGVALVDLSGAPQWEWSSFDHQDAISTLRMQPGLCKGFHYGRDTYDWTHANSVWPLPDEEAMLVSLRNVLMLAKVDLNDGAVLWRMGPGLDFTWLGSEPPEEQWFYGQHDIQMLPDGHLLMFDNGTCRTGPNCGPGPWSRALELEVDEDARLVSIAWEHRVKFAQSMGAVERLDDGNTFIFNGWPGDFWEVTPDHQEVWVGWLWALRKGLAIRMYPALWAYPK
jgi:hypothetical protein